MGRLSGEQCYVIASHLTRVRCVRELMRDLCPDIDGVISEAELGEVERVLLRWEEALRAKAEMFPE